MPLDSETRTVSLSAGESTTFTVGLIAGTAGDLTVSVSSAKTSDERGVSALTGLDEQALVTTGRDDRAITIQVGEVETTNQELSLSAVVDRETRDALARLREADDPDRVSTAFGAWRYLPRGELGTITVELPRNLQPPADRRSVAVTGYDETQQAPDRWEVTLTVGLEQPREREPPTLDGSEVVDTTTVALDSGDSTTTTLSFQAEADQAGDRGVRVRSTTDTDTAQVSITDAPLTIAWPAGSLQLSERQLGQIDSSGSQLSTTLRLTGRQMAVVFAAGSRVAGAAERSVFGGRDRIADTLPSDGLTATISWPDGAEPADGEYRLLDWSASYRTGSRRPWVAEITLTDRT